jgi:uncharacterized membrane protein YraQ (UPF0718 family)
MLVGVAIGREIVRALSFAGGMTWEILWALILGFALSGVVQAVVSKREMRRLMPDDSPKSLLLATGLGAASSSCSYAAVALARSLFTKGADFTAAMVFQFASTNLVFELGLLIAILLGWQFVVGEFVGGLLMIVLLVVLFRIFLNRQLVQKARREAEKGRLGSGRLPARHLLRHHGRRRLDRRVPVPGTRPPAHGARCEGHRSEYQLELHHDSQHHVPQPRRRPRLALFQVRQWSKDAAHDEQADVRAWPRPAPRPSRRRHISDDRTAFRAVGVEEGEDDDPAAEIGSCDCSAGLVAERELG